ncbi:PH domain-containing protein [Apiospora kogelbergensis]|uniref:PH domain-containing protein n=1 Tax=Apiospora kogelbergensis TaxID=1337665 RepID=UPI00312F8F5B
MAGLRSGDAAVPGEPPPAYVEFPSQMPPPSVSSSSLLPQYSCDLAFEAVFRMKMEIEDTVKRAEDRHWRSVFVHLRGPALYVYSVRRDWSWSGSGSRAGRSGGPGISSDNPPWLRRAKLEKTYTLLHADVGIAADYPKRRYVIRVRAETDQFLLSCIELSSFVRWLDALFAAINVAPVIDEREFPRDQSLPRVTRLAFSHGIRGPDGPGIVSRDSAARPAPVIHHSAMTPLSRIPADQPTNYDSLRTPPNPLLSSIFSPGATTTTTAMGGKWRPRHEWTSTHDMVYAKLCYSLLLFRSPRKSDYVVFQGKKWFVSDWTTGRMIRVLPPGYFDDSASGCSSAAGGPFRGWTAENRMI